MWAGIIDGVVLAVDIEKSDPLAVYFDAFALARWNFIYPGDGDKSEEIREIPMVAIPLFATAILSLLMGMYPEYFMTLAQGVVR